MSMEAINWAFAQKLPDPSQKLVLLAIANRIDNETGECFPGQALIAEEVTLSERQVRRILQALESAHYIRRRTRFRPDGYKTSDCYMFPGFMEWLNGAREMARAAHDAYVSVIEGKTETSAHVHVPPDIRDRRSPVTDLTGHPCPHNPKKNPKKNLSIAHPSDDATHTGKPKGAESKAAAGTAGKPQRSYYPADFETFWSLYPRKVGKAEAARVWKKLSAYERTRAVGSLNGYLQSQPVQDGFVQQGNTYLAKRTWEDYEAANRESGEAPSLWENRVRLYSKNARWPEKWGPAPGEPGCEVPASMIEALFVAAPHLRGARAHV